MGVVSPKLILVIGGSFQVHKGTKALEPKCVALTISSIRYVNSLLLYIMFGQFMANNEIGDNVADLLVLWDMEI